MGTPLSLVLRVQTIQIPFKETRDSTDSCRENVSVKEPLGVSGYNTMRVWAMETERRHNRRARRSQCWAAVLVATQPPGLPGIFQNAARR